MSNADKKREDLAEKVIALFKDNAYPFGGYLRDKIAGVPFNDLDMYFPKHNINYRHIGVYSFRKLLNEAGLVVNRVGRAKSIYNHTTGLRLMKDTFNIVDPDSGAEISVDMVESISASTMYDDHPFTTLDADVNSLWFNKRSGKIEVSPTSTYDFDRVVEHIARRVFELPHNMEINTERLTKLFANGYLPLDAEKQKIIKTQPATQRKENKMSTGSFASQFKSDMEKAAYRSCGTQMTSAVKQGLLLAMKNGGAEEGFLDQASKMLDTDAGTALVSAMLGNGLPYVPMIGNDPRVTRLSGYAQGMNLMMAALMQYVLPGIMQALQSLPPVTSQDMEELDAINNAKVRVAGLAPSVPDLSLASEREQEAEMELGKTRKTACR